MLEHNANLFYFAARNLQFLQVEIIKAIEERGGSDLPNKSEASHTRRVARRIKAECERLGFYGVLERLENLNIDDKLLQPFIGHPLTLDRLRWELQEVDKEIAKGLGLNKFLMIPTDKVGYYEQPKLFGQKVYRNFKSSRSDVKEIGCCYAVGRNTACVFHCMRVLEKGLHALVDDLNNRFNAGLLFSKGMETANWGTIIDRIESLLTTQSKLQQLTPQLTQQDRQFYAQAAKEFQYFKDAWRNDVSHSRSSYDHNQAKAVIEHVRVFMQHLATRLHE